MKILNFGNFLDVLRTQEFQQSPNPNEFEFEMDSIWPFKECDFIKHPLMGFGKSQQGMWININTP